MILAPHCRIFLCRLNSLLVACHLVSLELCKLRVQPMRKTCSKTMHTEPAPEGLCNAGMFSVGNIVQGDDAYKPSVFGSTITIERRIAATGHSTWTLRDHARPKGGNGRQV